MEPRSSPSSIHHRRRWFYVLWGILLVAAAGLLGWWETPAREGTARVRLVLNAPDSPPGTRIALWIGSARTWDPGWQPTEAWSPLQAGSLNSAPARVRIAQRRLGQGLLMRRSDDLAIAILEAPGGERRYFVYDLREDLGGLLSIGRYLTVNASSTWAGLPNAAVLPPDGQRMVVGH